MVINFCLVIIIIDIIDTAPVWYWGLILVVPTAPMIDDCGYWWYWWYLKFDHFDQFRNKKKKCLFFFSFWSTDEKYKRGKNFFFLFRKNCHLLHFFMFFSFFFFFFPLYCSLNCHLKILISYLPKVFGIIA